MSDDPSDDDDDEIITCWCGAQGRAADLFDADVFRMTCGGTGSLDCHCGGDQCVCHHHGEVECPGCEDCEFEDDGDCDCDGDEMEWIGPAAEDVAQPQWKEIPEQPAGDQDRSSGPGTAPADFGEGVFDA